MTARRCPGRALDQESRARAYGPAMMLPERFQAARANAPAQKNMLFMMD
jgi:hypothetical protein